MFANKYRYVFIAVLATYTYLNTVLCEVYKYFNIPIEWYVAFATITIITLLIWETSRLIEPFFKKLISRQQNKIRTLVVFFITAVYLPLLLQLA
ncbi:hypothetical protein [Ferruginibacter sp.]